MSQSAQFETEHTGEGEGVVADEDVVAVIMVDEGKGMSSRY